MKILLLNGSPRLSGNTNYALSVISEGISMNTPYDVETINVAKLKVSGCTACSACRINGGNCVMNDDGREIIEKVYKADAVVFGTPVYWWGISSQMKAVLDKFYSKTSQFKEQNKKVGVVAVGASAVPNRQYELINSQFECICAFLGWDIVFELSYSASAEDDLRKSEKAYAELSEIWKRL